MPPFFSLVIGDRERCLDAGMVRPAFLSLLGGNANYLPLYD
jgi:hypothetical protein